MQQKLAAINATIKQVDKIKAIILGEYFNRGGWSAENSGLTIEIKDIAATNMGLANKITRLQSSGAVGYPAHNPAPLTAINEAEIDRMALQFHSLLA